MTVTAVLIGLGFGTALLLIGSGVRRRPVPLGALADRLARPGMSINDTRRHLATPAATVSGDWRVRVGRAGLGLFGTMSGTDPVRLRLAGKTAEAHMTEKLVAGTAGLGLPVAAAVAAGAAGVGVNIIAATVAGFVAGTAGFFYPELPLRDRVEDRRREFRHSLSAFLDLVTIIMAGGGGLESALLGAAEASDGWAFIELHDALVQAELTRQTPWDVLARLGDDLGINELVELAASVGLAGGHGARIKGSLVAKADSLRDALAAEIEALAESQTERMILPVMVMILGLVFFVGYGAIQAISGPPVDPATVLTETPNP